MFKETICVVFSIGFEILALAIFFMFLKVLSLSDYIKSLKEDVRELKTKAYTAGLEIERLKWESKRK